MTTLGKSSKSSKSKTKPTRPVAKFYSRPVAKLYCGVREPGSFCRTYEEDEAELVYTVFTSVRKPTRRSHPRYQVVVGPFPTRASAECFRDVSGVNTVDSAVGRAAFRASIRPASH